MKQNDFLATKASALALHKKAQAFKKTAKAKFAKLLRINYATLETTDGQVLYIDGDEIAVGLPVFLLNDSGEYIEAPDQTVVVDGVTYVIEGGVIASINEPGGEGEGEGTAMADQDPEAIETPAEVSGEVEPETVNELIETVEEILDVVTDQEKVIEEQADEIEAINAELNRAKRVTNGKLADAKVSRFNRMKKISSVDERFERLKKNFRK